MRLKLWATDSSARDLFPIEGALKSPQMLMSPGIWADFQPWYHFSGAEARKSGSVCDENSLPTLLGSSEAIFPPPAKTRESSFPNGVLFRNVGPLSIDLRVGLRTGWGSIPSPPRGHLQARGRRVSRRRQRWAGKLLSSCGARRIWADVGWDGSCGPAGSVQ